jgi:hypothetical protein
MSPWRECQQVRSQKRSECTYLFVAGVGQTVGTSAAEIGPQDHTLGP